MYFTRLRPTGENVRIIGATEFHPGGERAGKRDVCHVELISGDRVRVKQHARVFDRTGKLGALRTRNMHKVPCEARIEGRYSRTESPRCRDLSLAELRRFQHLPTWYGYEAMKNNITRPQLIAAIGNGYDVAVFADIIAQVVGGNEVSRGIGNSQLI